VSCNSEKKQEVARTQQICKIKKPVIIVDCDYTLEEAIAGSKAPKEILSQLQLINVQYYSTDGKIHQGQILTNRKMVNRMVAMFRFMKQVKFPVVQAIPVVKYNWNDDLSMQANNTYSFCYRNPSYSKHARGMAIDINPYFNPLRWKNGYTPRQNKPVGASYNPSVSGTFYDSNPVVLEFRKNGLRWGRTFSRKYDDHHFEM
jgi:hypothetical protein